MYMSLNKKATIVLFLILQSTPTYVNEVAGYSVMARNLGTYKLSLSTSLPSPTPSLFDSFRYPPFLTAFHK